MIDKIPLKNINSTMIKNVCLLAGIDIGDKIDLILKLKDDIVNLEPQATIGELLADPMVSKAISSYSAHKLSKSDQSDPLNVPIGRYLDSKCKCPLCGAEDHLRYFVPKLNELSLTKE